MTKKGSQNDVLSIEDIFAAPDLAEEVMEIPEWGGAIKIKALTKGQQQDARTRSMVAGEINADKLEMYIFIYGVAEPQFTEEHFGKLRAKSYGVIDRVLRRIMQLSGMDVWAEQRAERSFR